MALVKMLRTMTYYPDGYSRRNYVAGEVYDISGDQLTVFFDEGAVEMVNQKPEAAPENKARKRAPRTKG